MPLVNSYSPTTYTKLAKPVIFKVSLKLHTSIFRIIHFVVFFHFDCHFIFDLIAILAGVISVTTFITIIHFTINAFHSCKVSLLIVSFTHAPFDT